MEISRILGDKSIFIWYFDSAQDLGKLREFLPFWDEKQRIWWGMFPLASQDESFLLSFPVAVTSKSQLLKLNFLV